MMRRFLSYGEKVFGLEAMVATLSDSREKPQIPTASVFGSVFALLATRRGSLNGWESETRTGRSLKGLTGPRPPSADTIGRVFALLDPLPLRAMQKKIVGRLARNKALPSPWGLRVAALDGHEFFSLQAPALSVVQPAECPGGPGGGDRVLPPGRLLPPGGP